MSKIWSLVFILVSLCLLSVTNRANAADALPYLIKDINIDTPTLVKGYTVTSTDDHFFLGIRPEVLAIESRVMIKQFDSQFFNFPAGLEPISNIYEFDIKNKQAFVNEKPLLLKFLIDQPTNDYKRIYFYNGVIDQWVELPSYSDGSNLVKSIIHLPYAKLVILKDKAMEYGSASWYKYQGCDCAASPDYPAGTVLQVTNLDNNKCVVVKVNDFGPDRAIHPDRVIDLDSVAFKKIGELWQGILSNIKVEPIAQ